MSGEWVHEKLYVYTVCTTVHNIACLQDDVQYDNNQLFMYSTQ